MEIPVTVTVNTFPVAVEVFSTVTSLASFKEPVPTVESPTLRVTEPAVSPKPPNFASKEVIFTSSLREVVNVILVAGALDDPTCA